jgi:AcrR family transcriptional regulator
MARRKRASNNPRGRPRSAEVTEGIHAALLDLLKGGPYQALSVDGIAARAGVSRPAFYRRYANVGQATLGSLLAIGGTILPMPKTKDVEADLVGYFHSLAVAIDGDSPVGRALRGVLASSLIDPGITPHFGAFIDRRRQPVLQRLLAWKSALSPAELEKTLDAMFGPTLYRLLIRHTKMERDDVAHIVRDALEKIT